MEEIKNPKVDFEVDNDFKGTLVITCGECSTVTRVPFGQVSLDNNIKCNGCDYEFKLTGDDCKALQKQLDDSKNRSDRIGSR